MDLEKGIQMAPMDVCCRHCCWYADIYRNVCLPVKTTEICKQESKHFILQRTRIFAMYSKNAQLWATIEPAKVVIRQSNKACYCSRTVCIHNNFHIV